MENNIIVVKQLPIIEEQLEQLKASVDQRVNEAVSMVCTEDTRQTVKSVRAALNKEFKEWETLRKNVKSSVLTPYENFEKKYRECVADAYRDADTALKEKIDAVESEIKETKTAEIECYYDEVRESMSIPEDVAPFERSGLKVTLSTSVSSLKKRAVTFLERIAGEVEYIQSLEHSDEIMIEFKKTLNAVQAFNIVHERHKAMEEERQRREADREAEGMRAAAQTEVKQAIEDEPDFTDNFNGLPVIEMPVAEQLPENEFSHEERDEYQAPAVDTDIPVYTVRFSVTGTIDQLRRLKKYMEQEGLNYVDI